MENLTSDDLLIKSQLLISKFRKQREFSLQKQDKTLHSLHSYNSTNENQLTAQNLLKRNLQGFYKYPQKDIENVLFNSFQKHFYHLDESQFNNQSFHNDKNHDNISASDNSLWSYSTESTHLNKVDCGVMTDFQEKFNDEDEMYTPVTALPSTVRGVEKSRYVKENPLKIFSSISTTQNMSDYSTSTINDTLNATSKNHILNFQKVSHSSLNEIGIADENIKMKTALELFELENQMNLEINIKTQFLETLNFELRELSKRINEENNILDELKIRKDEIKNKRYEIFHGTSDESELQKNETKDSFYDNASINRFNSKIDSNACETYSNINNNACIVKKVDNSLYNLDNETVRNIVDKIINKEFSNSEDNIFLKTNSNIQTTSINDEIPIKNLECVEDYILSDVLSVKDLKIGQSSASENFINNNLSISPKKSKTYDIPPQQSKFKSIKVKSAHSVDNIACHSIPSNSHVSRPNSRRKLRSPAISEELRRYLHYKSNSDNSS